MVVSILEPVRFLDPYGKPFPGKLKIGDLLAEGHYAEAGKGGELGLLLSNGTLLSLEPGTRIRIGLFGQQPFESVKSKLSDLPEEPSLSQVEIDLNFGALVVKTKKLRPSSSFLIRSSSGISRVQGTQFQLSQNPASDMQLERH